MFLLDAIDKRITDLTTQLKAMETLGMSNKPKYESILAELISLTEKRETFLETWPKNFPYWFR